MTAKENIQIQRLISLLIKILALNLCSVDYEPVVWVDVLISWLFAADTDTVQRQTHRQRQMSSSESLCISRKISNKSLHDTISNAAISLPLDSWDDGVLYISYMVVLTCGLPGTMKLIRKG